MNRLITTVGLSLGGIVAFGQAPPDLIREPAPRLGSELQIGYVRETYKMRDLQASPMLYVANLNGVQLAYSRLTAKNGWRIQVQAGLGDLVAPGLGIRPVKFTTDQPQPLWLNSTLYQGRVELDYRRLIRRTANRTGWLGLGLRGTLRYADGLVLSTWAFTTMSASVLYQWRWTLSPHHTLMLDASLPILAAVGRMPYGNVVSEPAQSNASTFLRGSRWATVNQFLNPQVDVSYRFSVSRRVAFQAAYQYSWLRYTEPRLVRLADHRANLSVIYTFQRSYR